MVRHKLQRVLQDGDVKDMLRGSSIALVVKVLGALTQFVFAIMLARMLGVQGAGIYFLGLTVVSLVSIVGRLGMAPTLTKKIAEEVAVENWAKAKAIYATGMMLCCFASAILSMVVYQLADYLAIDLFNEPDLIPVMHVMSLSILPLTMVWVIAGALRGLTRTLHTQMVESLLLHVFCMLAFLSIGSEYGALGAGISYLFGCVVTAIIGLYLWHVNVRGKTSGIDEMCPRELLSIAVPLLIVSSLHVITVWSGNLLLGIYGTTEDVALFQAVTRAIFLISLVLLSINNYMSPRISARLKKEEHQQLRKQVNMALKLGFVTSLPIVLVMMAFPSYVLWLFGEEFMVAGSALLVVAASHLVNIATGPVGVLLTMSGHGKSLRNASALSVLVQVVLSLILIPEYGVMGAAIGLAAATVVVNVLSVVLVYRKLGIQSHIIAALLNK